MGATEIEQFLGHLATERHVSASTQNQAFSALLFLYQKVLEIELPTIDALRAKRTRRLPVVLSVVEVKQLWAGLAEIETREPYALMARLMYGTGMRIMECCRLTKREEAGTVAHGRDAHATFFLERKRGASGVQSPLDRL